MKYLLSSMIFLLLLCRPVMADDINDVEHLLKENVDALIAVLQHKEFNRQSRNERVIEIVNSVFDFELMAKLSLGKKYWPGSD